jgi:outer membrane protein assembly factor BamE (lipoprotein component of BamABCDE complex)
MILRNGRSLFVAALGAGLLLAGCTKVVNKQGFVVDETLVSAVQVGTDTRDSVMTTLGRPSFTAEFDPNTWYYVSRDTKNLAFNKPHSETQTVLRIRFDQAGNVASVDRRGLEQVASINPSGDKTPTLGRRKSLFDELFGNIGAVGQAGQRQSTTDNPR